MHTPAPDRILLIRAGGTIDAAPYPDAHKPPHLVQTLKGDDSLIMRTVAQLPQHEKVDGMHWGQWREKRFVKDSQEYTADDITALADIIRQDPRRYFVLTHGTSAMAPNARMLQEALQGTDKVVVLTGAMVPLSMAQAHPTDAVDALRYTLQRIERQGPGVWIVGRNAETKLLSFFNPMLVEKNNEMSLASLQFTLNQR